MSYLKTSSGAIVIWCYLCHIVFCGRTYTPEMKNTIQQLREAMGNGGQYSHQYKDYMKNDDYLIRFLEDRNFDVSNAKMKLMESLKWRKENKMEEILSEDMGDLYGLFPYDIRGTDFESSPLLTIPFGKWDVRKFMLRGNGREQMGRYTAQLFERASKVVRVGNVTHGVVIINMNNYNARQHGCAACLPFYFDLLTQYEKYYPAYVKNFNFINTPRAWEAVTKILLPLVSPVTKDVIQIFGYNKKEWQTELLKTIKPDQLSLQFGGTRKD